MSVCSTDHAEVLARRILDASVELVRLDPHTEVVIGVSIGVTHVESHRILQRPDELLRRADQAMYEAKRRGKGQIVTLCTRSLDSVRRAASGADLPDGWDRVLTPRAWTSPAQRRRRAPRLPVGVARRSVR